MSYVLSGKGTERAVAQSTQDRVREIALQLGWQPNHMRSAFFTGKTRLIGMWQRGSEETYHSLVTKALQDFLHNDGYAMLNSSAYAARSDNRPDFQLFNQWSVEGLISLGGTYELQRFMEEYPQWRLPLVNMGSFPLKVPVDFDSVYVDVLTPARAGLDRWIAEGRRRMAMLSGHGPCADEMDPREDMYRRCMRDHGLTEELVIFPKGASQRVGARLGLREHVARHGCPDAIFCRSDETLMGAAKALQAMGCRVPDDVDLLGIDGIRDIYYLGHPVSSVAQPREEMCRMAWRLLQKRIAQPDRPVQRIILSGTLLWPASLDE